MAAEVGFSPATTPDAAPSFAPQSVATAPAVSVVVVNFRRPDCTSKLARQLDTADAMRSGQAEIVLVDNDIDPRPIRRLMRRQPGVVIRSFGLNRGFARAVNEGCRVSRGQWLLLLNPDVRAPEEFLDGVINAADRLAAEDPRTGVVGFELRHADGSPQASAGPFPTLANVLTGLVRPRARRRCRPASATARQPIDWVTGCCLLIRRECWLELGGFDEDFFLYYEDVDFCRRAKGRGWSVWYDPSLGLIHDHPLHRRQITPVLRLVTRHALLTYAIKHWPGWQSHLLSRLVRLESQARGLWARCFIRPDVSELYRRLDRLAAELMDGRHLRARRHLIDAARALVTEPVADTAQ